MIIGVGGESQGEQDVTAITFPQILGGVLILGFTLWNEKNS